MKKSEQAGAAQSESCLMVKDKTLHKLQLTSAVFIMLYCYKTTVKLLGHLVSHIKHSTDAQLVYYLVYFSFSILN